MILYFLLIFMNFVPYCFMGLHCILLNTTYFYRNRKLKIKNIVVRIKWTWCLNSNFVSVQCNLLREQYLLLFTSTEKEKKIKRQNSQTHKRKRGSRTVWSLFSLIFVWHGDRFWVAIKGKKGRERERERLFDCGVCVRERKMGRLFVITLEGNIYSCKHCRTHLALSDDIVSKVFVSFPSSPLLIDLFALFFWILFKLWCNVAWCIFMFCSCVTFLCYDFCLQCKRKTL